MALLVKDHALALSAVDLDLRVVQITLYRHAAIARRLRLL